MKKAVAVMLAILAVYLIYLGMQAEMIPPVLTGVGFVLIALAFAFSGKK